MTPVEDYKLRAQAYTEALHAARWSLLRAVLSLHKEGLSQVKIASELGISQGHVSRLLSHFDTSTMNDVGVAPNPMAVLCTVMQELQRGA